jgi:hypothetical protein
MSERVLETQAPDLCNGSIAVTLQEFGDLTTEDLIIEDQTAQIR